MDIVKTFEEIRDVPYRIPVAEGEVDNCCSGKVMRLKAALDKAGYKTRYRVCDFRWSDLPLPEEVSSVEHEDESTHVYLEVLMQNKWIDLDPTWDSGIQDVFPISYWDGVSSTPIAVPSVGLYSHEESRQIMEEPDTSDVEYDLKRNGDFYKALNEWLARKRAGSLL